MSPWGNRGEICKYFGWHYEYLLWGITWTNLQLMLADAPNYGADKETDSSVSLDTKKDIINYFKSRK